MSRRTAERAVRTVKESLKTLMLDHERQFGLGLVFEPVFLQYALNYVCFAHNNFAVVQDSKRSPREIALGERVKTDSFALFGSKVFTRWTSYAACVWALWEFQMATQYGRPEAFT